ncbi:MAG: MmcQ/YjbR family DNA-binding protein [Oceanicaulis sp.]
MTAMHGWPDLRAFALRLDLPGVEDCVSWGNPGLKAHGKLWTWWAPQADADAPVFKVAREEQEFLLEAAPEVFFVTDHHRPHGLILMRPAAFDADWARGNLFKVWRKQAPKRMLRAWDAENADRLAEFGVA